MNKNLTNLSLVFEPIGEPETNSFIEDVEWCIYQMKELRIKMDTFLERGVVTRAFANHVDQVRESVINTMISMKTRHDYNNQDPRMSELKQIVKHLVQVVEELNKIPFKQ